MFLHMPPFAMDRHRNAWLHQRVKAAQFFACWVAGDMHHRLFIRDHAAAAAHQPILHALNGDLIPRYLAGGEDHRIAFAECNGRVLVFRDLRHGGTGFALAAGANQQDFIIGQEACFFFIQKGRERLQITAFAGRGFHVAQRPPQQRDLSPCRAACHRNAFHARNIGRKAGDGDAPLDTLDQFRERSADFRLTPRMAFNQSIGGIANHGEHAFFAKPGEGAFIRGRADQRFWVKLPIARVQHKAIRGTQHQRLGFRDGMRHGDETAIKGAKLHAPARGQFQQAHFMDHAGFTKLAAQHGKHKGSAIDGAAQLPPQMHHRADMVFMRMGDDEAKQSAAVFGKPGRIRHHDIGFRLIRPGKAKPAIHRQQGAIATIDIKVHSDLTRPAQRDKGKIAGHNIHGANQNPI